LPTTPSTIEILDRGQPIGFMFEDMMRFHGPASPGGVAHAFKVMERAWPLLDAAAAPERRELTVDTAFGGPGARDAFELVTRAVSEGRYVVDRALARLELGRARERFVFRLGYRGSAVTLLVREGFVTDEFIELARKSDPTPEDAARLDALKKQMADLVMATPAAEVYDVVDAGDLWVSEYTEQ
jgi:hypothetical protein